MQRDDRPPASGRPSLLSAEQQAEADRQRILSKLDGKTSSTSTPPTRRSKFAWAGAGIGVVALCAAAAVWVAYDGQNLGAPAPAMAAAPVTGQAGAPPPAVTAIDAVSTTPADQAAMADPAGTAPGAAGPAGMPAAAVTAASTAEPDVSTAAILADVDEPAEKEKTLKEILHASTPAAAVAAGVTSASAAAAPKLAANPAPDELTRLLDKPTPRAPLPVAAKKTPKRMAETAKPRAKLAAQKTKEKDAEKHRLAVAPSKKKELHPKASKPIDSDVALLAALVAHSKAYPEKIKPGSTAAKLKQCGKQSSANAGKCRERVCNGSGKDDLECKGVRLAKATVAS